MEDLDLVVLAVLDRRPFLVADHEIRVALVGIEPEAEGGAAVVGGEDEAAIAERGTARCRIHFFGVERVLLEEGWVSDRFGVRQYALDAYGVTKDDLEPIYDEYLSAFDIELEGA